MKSSIINWSEGFINVLSSSNEYAEYDLMRIPLIYPRLILGLSFNGIKTIC